MMTSKRIDPDPQTTPREDDEAPSDTTLAPGSYRMIFPTPEAGRSGGKVPPSGPMPRRPKSPARLWLDEEEILTQVAPRTEQAAQAPSSLRPSGARHAPGDVLVGRYRLVQRLGEGGMGTVWQARSLPLNIDVALKLLRRDVWTLEGGERLLNEAQAAARLGHPNVVRVLDAGLSGAGDPFVVMELLKGISLADQLRAQGPMAPAAAVQLLLPVASALVAAHEASVIHRDLKPGNVILVQNEAGAIVPKLIDFGVARVSRGGVGPRLTELGMVVGSPSYLAPEQARGELDVDERADVWGLSVLLYELIDGIPPFDKGRSSSVLAAILNQAPEAPRALGAHHPLWAILRRGLEKNRQDRWRTMRAFGKALARWALDNGVREDIMGMSIDTHWLRRPSMP